MFEIPRLSGTLERSAIVVETRTGYRLENFLVPEPGIAGVNAFQAIVEKHGKQWHVRRHQGGGYNCAGLLWASRRAALPSPEDWKLILADSRGDGYRRLEDEESVEPGDIAVYLHATLGEILHVGRVCALEWMYSASGERIGNRPRIRVLSKLDARLGEVIHTLADVCPLNGGEPFTVELWTERPQRAFETLKKIIL